MRKPHIGRIDIKKPDELTVTKEFNDLLGLDEERAKVNKSALIQKYREGVKYDREQTINALLSANPADVGVNGNLRGQIEILDRVLNLFERIEKYKSMGI